MAGTKGNKAHANNTSFPNQKNNTKSRKVVLRKFKEMYDKAKEDKNILCFQDACASIGWRDSKVNYWCRIIPIFATLKTDIQNIITARINSGALKSDFNPTASIWRMKQLGEIDEKIIDNKSTDGSMTPQQLTPEAAKAIEKDIDKEI